MKYLDAKKKLMFMMAATKYLRIKIKQGHIITKEYIETWLPAALPIVFKDCEITTQEIAELRDSLSSLLFSKVNTFYTKTKSYISAETIVRDTIKINEHISVQEVLDITKTIAKVLGFKPQEITVEDLNTMLVNSSVQIASFDNLITSKEMLDVITSAIVQMATVNNKIDLFDAVDVITKQSNYFGIVDKNILNNFVQIYISDKKTAWIEAIDTLYLNSMIQTFAQNSNLVKIDNQFGLDNSIKIRSDLTKLITANNFVTTKNKINFAHDKPNLVKTNAKIMINPKFSLEAAKAPKVKVTEALKTTSLVDIILINFIALPLAIKAKIYMDEDINIEDTSPLLLDINSSILNTDSIDIYSAKSDLVKHDITKVVDAQVTMKSLRYALIEDWDPKDLIQMDNLTISDLIYIDN